MSTDSNFIGVSQWSDKSGTNNHATAYAFSGYSTYFTGSNVYYHPFDAVTELPTYDPAIPGIKFVANNGTEKTIPQNTGTTYAPYTLNTPFSQNTNNARVYYSLGTSALQTRLPCNLDNETTFVVVKFIEFKAQMAINSSTIVTASTVLGCVQYITPTSSTANYPKVQDSGGGNVQVSYIGRNLVATNYIDSTVEDNMQISSSVGANNYSVKVNGGSWVNNTYILGLTRSATTSTVRRNGVSASITNAGYNPTASSVAGNNNATLIGMDQPFYSQGWNLGSPKGLGYGSSYTGLDGYVYEIITYNSVLSESQCQQVEGYLAWKWGLPDPNIMNPEGSNTYQTSQPLVPTTHPFTKFPSATVGPY